MFGKDVIKGGCVPRDDAMDDFVRVHRCTAQICGWPARREWEGDAVLTEWSVLATLCCIQEDFVNMLALRYSPHLMHYVVWNEVASAGWMDCSPNTPNRAGPGASKDTRINREKEFGLAENAGCTCAGRGVKHAHRCPV